MTCCRRWWRLWSPRAICWRWQRTKSGCRLTAGRGAATHRNTPHIICRGDHEHQRDVELDPIVPEIHGGSDDPSNLQTLCFRCNACKRDSGTTDFRSIQASFALREAGYVICALGGNDRLLLEKELAVCIVDAYPVTSGHSVVVPRR